jgi:hypothetical protein
MKTIGYLLLVAGLSSVAYAGVRTPEIDAGFAGSAFALIGGVTLIVRSRRK